VRIEQPVKGFGAFRQLGEVAVLQRFGERVEQAPDVALLEGVVPRFAPFVKHGRDQSIGANADISGPDDEVMGFDVGDGRLFVGGDAFVLIVPFGKQKADGTADQLRQVADNETGVFASEFDLTTEGEIVANEHTGPGDDARGECFVVAVSQTEHPAIVIAGGLGVDFHEAKVALAFMGQRMGLVADPQVGGGQGSLHGCDQLMVRNGAPALSGPGCVNGADFVEVHMGGSAVKGEVGAASWREDDDRLRFELCNH
jgi:hypothetical protein